MGNHHRYNDVCQCWVDMRDCSEYIQYCQVKVTEDEYIGLNHRLDIQYDHNLV